MLIHRYKLSLLVNYISLILWVPTSRNQYWVLNISRVIIKISEGWSIREFCKCDFPLPLSHTDVHGLRKAHDLHVWWAHSYMQRQRGWLTADRPAVQRSLCLPLSIWHLEPTSGWLLQRWPWGYPVAHWSLHALPHGQYPYLQDRSWPWQFFFWFGFRLKNIRNPANICIKADFTNQTSG